MLVFINITNVRAHNWLCRLTISFLKQVRSQPIDHDLKVQRLIIELLVKLTIALMSRLLALVNALETLKLLMLLLSVLLHQTDLLPHLLLHKHVVLHATLQCLDDLPSVLAYPPCISLFV